MSNSLDLSSSTNLSPRAVALTRHIVLSVFFLVSIVYFLWRPTAFNPSYPIYSLLFYLAEIIGFTWLAINLLSLIYFKPRQSPIPTSDCSVDVFIPTYNEPVGLLRRTAIAALRISHPHKTWLLDDGNRIEVKKLADEIGCGYIARSNNIGAKAGNLNNALSKTNGDFIAIFDADFIASPEFLAKTLGYFSDDKVAFVQTPQEFYNFDSYQHLGKNRDQDLWSEHALFFHAQQRGRDMYNAAMFCGTSGVLRRKALEEIGGFAATTVTEDMHTSTLLHADGWKSVYHPEILSAGLAPHDAASFLRQRKRWAEGAIQIALQEGLFAGKMNLSFAQRMAYILHVGNYIEGPRHVFLYIASAVTLAFYVSPFQVSFQDWALFYLPFLSLGLLAYKEFSRGYGKVVKNEIFNMARCPALVGAFAVFFGKKKIDFKITPKVKGRPTTFLFPWIILAINAGALCKATHDYVSGSSKIGEWPIMIVAMWCLLGAWLAWQVCILTRRCNKNRRSFSRFPVKIPIVLEKEDKNCEAVVTQVSDRGLTISPLSNHQLPEGDCHGTMNILGKKITFDISLRPSSSGCKSGGRIEWRDISQKDEYEYLMMIDRIHALESLRFDDNKTYLGPLVKIVQLLYR